MIPTMLVCAGLLLAPSLTPAGPQGAATRREGGAPAAAKPAAGRQEVDLPQRIAARLRDLVRDGERARLLRYGTSRGNRPLLALRLTGPGAAADARPRPAILVVAGLDGLRLDDVAVAMRVLEAFAGAKKGDADFAAFENAHLFVIPCANPDGLASTSLATPMAGNGVAEDEDRDLRQGEDPPDDLDGDGAIAWMRIPDPKGPWIEDPDHPLHMKKADPAKDERGRYLLVPEGRDDDGDGLWNEDARGGVLPQRNFPHLYPEHGKGAGSYVLSTPCARALAEFCVAHPQIAAVLVFGDEDNLRTDPRKNRAKDRRPPTGILAEDRPYMAGLGALYREICKVAPGGHDHWEGRFHATAYAVLGRWTLASSLSAKPAPEEPDLVQEQLARTKVTEPANPFARFFRRGRRQHAGSSAGPSGPGSPGAAQPQKKTAKAPTSKPARAEQDEPDRKEPGTWVPWKPRDVPGIGRVEIGGLVMGSAQRLEAGRIPAIARAQTKFVCSLFARLPAPRIAKAAVKPLSEGVVALEVLVTNEGYLPPLPEMAKRLRNPRQPRIEVWVHDRDHGALRPWTLADDEPKLLIGRTWNFVGALKGKGSHQELRWVLRTGGPTTIELRLVQEGILQDRKEVRL